jgi:ATP-dependent helicase/nuclease subunit A
VLILVRRRGALFEEILRALKHARLPVAGADRLRSSPHHLRRPAGAGPLRPLPRRRPDPGGAAEEPVLRPGRRQPLRLATGRDGEPVDRAAARRGEAALWAEAAAFLRSALETAARRGRSSSTSA